MILLKAPIPEMDNSRFKFDVDLNQWVYQSRAKDMPPLVKKDDETFKQFVKKRSKTSFYNGSIQKQKNRQSY